MKYRLLETKEAINDVADKAIYMITKFSNKEAANDFIDAYDKQLDSLKTFPFGYRGISMEYRGYEIRIKSFGTYNMFFVVDQEQNAVIVLRVLKDRQDWKFILGKEKEYHW